MRTQRADEDRPKRAALTLDRTQDRAVLKGQRNPVFIRTYNHTDQCFFKPQLFHHQPAKTKHRHIPQFSRLWLKEYLDISRRPCKHTLLLSRLQHKSLVAPQYTRTDHNFPSITSKNIEGTLQNTQVLLYRASKI